MGMLLSGLAEVTLTLFVMNQSQRDMLAGAHIADKKSYYMQGFCSGLGDETVK